MPASTRSRRSSMNQKTPRELSRDLFDMAKKLELQDFYRTNFQGWLTIRAAATQLDAYAAHLEQEAKRPLCVCGCSSCLCCKADEG